MNMRSTHRYDTVDADSMALCIALNGRDEYTFLHSTRVSSLTLELGRQCSLSQAELNVLSFSSMLHDVGKVCIPDAVLLKPGNLNDEEWGTMKSHVTHSEAIVRAVQHDSIEQAAKAVRHHHERHDGNGYPDGLAGERIPVLSRVIALSDCYDAMATTRVYSRARSHAEILKILDEDDGHHDPFLRSIFFGVVEKSEFRAP